MAAQSRNIAELENASVWRLLIQYSLPSIAGMVVYSLYNIIDSVFIGHGVGPLALSGLAVTFPHHEPDFRPGHAGRHRRGGHQLHPAGKKRPGRN